LNKKIVTFGEIMLRLTPPDFKRFVQARSFTALFGGSEANVAVSLANFGYNAYYVTKLPKNEIGDACINYLRQFGVNTDYIARGGRRIGIYFLEMGTSLRPSKVIYDREFTAISEASRNDFNWDDIFNEAKWFHWSGITPAISKNLADILLDALKIAKEKNVKISGDLNYRKLLWKWGKEAYEVMPELIKYCDVIIGNEEDADKVLGIKAPNTDITSGKIDAENYRYVVEKMAEKFPNLKYIAITLRGSISASINTWSAILYDRKNLYISPTYEINPILDRVGGGDSFAAGLIYGLLNYTDNLQYALNFAVAASCLKHTIYGDFNLVSIDEVLKIVKGDISGRVSR